MGPVFEPMFFVELYCCGRDDGYFGPVTWSEADSFREDYCTGPGVGPSGHDRVGIIIADTTGSIWPVPIWRYKR